MNNDLLDAWMQNGGDEESFAQELILSYATFASLSTEHKKVMVLYTRLWRSYNYHSLCETR